MLLQLLEDKHFGRLTTAKVFKLANNNANFANLWLVQAIRSDCSLNELALAIAANIKWQSKNLALLERYLPETELANDHLSNELLQAMAYSQDIIQDFCQQRQAKLLIRITSLAETITTTKIDTHKMTCNLSLSLEQLNDILTSCSPHLKDAVLFGAEGKSSQDKGIRNNSHFPTPLPNDSMALALLEHLLAKASGLPIGVAEPPVVLRYLPEQYYHWHYDHIYPHTEDIKKHIAQFGQRVKSAIFYLNDDFVGGETEFKTPFISITPKQNKALIFDNCDQQGNRYSDSIHRGKSVISGEKWIVTLWFRDKPFWLRSGLL
ncbi:2OG-Fe(II) oxygenase superfamily protein [Colwellia chukchiensis]|uniref:2OG-Fe(II) oxygenase superfamily protein n=1 Tax=Colwellia chukchiensis TaxID=641665 RepID=A0A1H7U4G0_9GAMM|nr:2OG-Fe(II) oxygenase [Colwellia chukchiensis]SEL91863.1 2OG-Fe(II) oxygenase superfamily protein [Colwellia chukchiensis]